VELIALVALASPLAVGAADAAVLVASLALDESADLAQPLIRKPLMTTPAQAVRRPTYREFMSMLVRLRPRDYPLFTMRVQGVAPFA
jgi:hypothetical protein